MSPNRDDRPFSEQDTSEMRRPAAQASSDVRPAKSAMERRGLGWLAVAGGLAAAILFAWFVASLAGNGDPETSAKRPAGTTTKGTPRRTTTDEPSDRGRVRVVLQPRASSRDEESTVVFNGRSIRPDQIPGVSAAAGTASGILGGLAGRIDDGTIVVNGQRVPVSALPALERAARAAAGSTGGGSGSGGARGTGSGTTSAGGNGTGGIGGGRAKDGTVVFNGKRIPASQVPARPASGAVQPSGTAVGTPTAPTPAPTQPARSGQTAVVNGVRVPVEDLPAMGLSGRTVVFNGVRIPVEHMPAVPSSAVARTTATPGPAPATAPAATATTPAATTAPAATIQGTPSSSTAGTDAAGVGSAVAVPGAPGAPAAATSSTACCSAACCSTPPR